MVAPNGDVYVVWLDADNNSSGSGARIKFIKATNGGVTFSGETTVLNLSLAWRSDFGAIRSGSLPTIAVDPTNGNIYVAAIDWNGGNINIHFARSTDGGDTWEPNPNDPSADPFIPTETTAFKETFPWLSVDELGDIYLAYYTDKHDPGNKVDVYLARSTDGGVSFESNDVRVSSVSSDPTAQANPDRLSDYLGVTSRSNIAYVAWADFRNGNADIFFASVDYNPPTSVEDPPPAPLTFISKMPVV